MKTALNVYEPPPRCVEEVNGLLDAFVREFATTTTAASIAQRCAVMSKQLPADISDFLQSFRRGELGSGPAVLRMSATFIPDLPPTPNHWKSSSDTRAGWREEIALVLLSSLLGEPFGWSTQQNGRLVHDVLPIHADEDKQIGTGSRQKICWHIEDAFSAFRARYLGLLCLRNPSCTATTFGVPDLTRLSSSCRETLRKEQFLIRPDYSQEPNGVNSPDQPLQAWKLPEACTIAVLGSGNIEGELRLDPYFMPQEHLSAEAKAALNELIGEIDRDIREVVLRPGDCLFIDNACSVHGRAPFQARYDGSDRWLKRLNIASRGSLATGPLVSPERLACLPN